VSAKNHFCPLVVYPVKILNKLYALFLERLHHPFVVHYRLSYIDRRAICIKRMLHNLNRSINPGVWDEAIEMNLEVVDAVCPLVTKVHNEVKSYAEKGYTIVLIGHRNHVEVIGTSGEAPDKVVVVESVEEAAKLTIPNPDKVAYVTQTTLSVDDTRDILDTLKKRFPKILSPSKLDICYATQNRQDAVKALSKQAGIVFIMGSPESSNSNRLVEVAKANGVQAYLIEGADNLNEDMFTEDMVVGLSSGASTPETVVLEVITRLKEFGADSVEELDGKEENTRFPFPETINFTSTVSGG